MGVIRADCDECGKKLNDGEMYPDHNGQYYCKKCECKNEIESLERECADAWRWLKETHIKGICDKRKKIRGLRAELHSAAEE